MQQKLYVWGGTRKQNKHITDSNWPQCATKDFANCKTIQRGVNAYVQHSRNLEATAKAVTITVKIYFTSKKPVPL